MSSILPLPLHLVLANGRGVELVDGLGVCWRSLSPPSLPMRKTVHVCTRVSQGCLGAVADGCELVAGALGRPCALEVDLAS